MEDVECLHLEFWLAHSEIDDENKRNIFINSQTRTLQPACCFAEASLARASKMRHKGLLALMEDLKVVAGWLMIPS